MTWRIGFLALLFLTMAAALGVESVQAQRKATIPYPSGYRQWTHVKTMVIFSKENKLFDRFGGLHNIYVNHLGVSSLQQGRAYPDGTTFVFDLYDIRTFRGAIETRGRKFIGVMKKNSKLYAQTGGWGFEVFRGYEQVGSLQDSKACFDCHASRKSADYVFSTMTR
jgi:hypothetical protein